VEESLLQSFCVNAVSEKVVRHSLGLSVQKWFAGDIRYYLKLLPKLTHPLKNLKCRFPINIRS